MKGQNRDHGGEKPHHPQDNQPPAAGDDHGQSSRWAAAECLLTEFTPPDLDQWRAEVDRLLRGADFDRKLLTPTYEEITLRPMYSTADSVRSAWADTDPGDPPYIRGTRPLQEHPAAWEVAQELPLPTCEVFNAALVDSLARGQTVVNLKLDVASRCGLDPRQAAADHVGRDGTNLASLADLTAALADIDPTAYPLIFQAGAASLPLAAMLVALVREQGGDPALLHGVLGDDPLRDQLNGDDAPLSVERGYDSVAELTRWSADRAPRLRTVTADGSVYHEAGASVVQELAYTLAAAVTHLRELEARDLDLETVASHLQFTFGVGNHFFMEIAKLRAARLLWSHCIAACGGSAAAQRMNQHVKTSSWSRTVYAPHNNILRGTTEALAAVVGGCDSLHIAPFTQRFGPPDRLALRLARNCQIILREEAHLDRVVDPAGGSWFVETLTDQVARQAWVLFQEIEAAGGLLAALGKNSPQKAIALVVAKRRENFHCRREVLVGTNRYPDPDEVPAAGEDLDHDNIKAARIRQHEERPISAELSASRQHFESSLAQFETSTGEIFEAAVKAVAAGASSGELLSALAADGAESPSLEPLPTGHLDDLLVRQRRLVEAGHSTRDGAPDVFLANVGPVAEYMARLDFARTFFQVGGFQVAGEDWFDDPDSAAAAAIASGAPIVCIVATDARYPDLVPELTGRLKAAARPPTVVVAGRPPSLVEVFEQIGVDHCLQFTSDVHELLGQFAKELGVAE
ncbi:MAG: acyl-CoA mutase large subunit family protein [bacterium]